MSRVLAGLRRLAESAGPREGRAPTVVTRAFTARRNRVLDGASGVAAVVDVPHADDVRALVVTEDGRAELVSALLGVAAAGDVESAAVRALLASAVSAVSAAPGASSLALPSAGVASCLVVAGGGVRRLEPAPAEVLAAAEALAAQLEPRLPGLVR
jgi:hypothetical protein